MAPKSLHPPMSTAEERELLEFMARMSQQNRLAEVMGYLRETFEGAPVEQQNQSMTDASKRRRSPVQRDPWEVVREQDVIPPGAHNDRPQPSSMASGSSFPQPSSMTSGSMNDAAPFLTAEVFTHEDHVQELADGVKLPNGIESLHHWGSTLCVLPKVAKMRLNYRELVDRSRHDEDLRKYLLMFILRHQGNSDRVHDLKNYLRAIRYTGGETIVHYNGSTSEVRIFKD